MRANEIIKNLGKKCTRHLLRHWDEYVRPRRKGIGKSRGTEPQPRFEDYTPAQVALLCRMLDGSLKGLTPSESAERARRHWLDQDNLQSISREMARVSGDLLSRESGDSLFALQHGLPPPLTHAVRRGKGLDRFAKVAQKLLGVENFGIFLADRPQRKDLVLVADTKSADEPLQLGFRIVDYQHAPGWTATVATQLAPKNLVWPELATRDAPEPTHLKSGRRSLLAIPMVDRKGSVLGILKAENKRSAADGMNFGVFDDSDERVMTALTATIIPLLELHRILIRGTEMVHRLSGPMTFREFGRNLLEVALRVTSADHAEISLWDNERGLVFEVVDVTNALQPDTALTADKPSLTYTAYSKGIECCVPDVTHPPDGLVYHECNAATKSEIAIPIKLGDQAIGVLNVESNRNGGDGGLEETDLPFLRVLGAFAAVAAQFAILRDSVVESIPEPEFDAMLKLALIQAKHKLNRGALYTLDHFRGELRLRRPKGNRPLETLSLGERALATKIALEAKPRFTRFPEYDPDVWWEGLKKFGITGSLLGFPILSAAKRGATVLGVIILWDDAGARLTDEEGEEIIRRCMKVMRLQIALSKP